MCLLNGTGTAHSLGREEQAPNAFQLKNNKYIMKILKRPHCPLNYTKYPCKNIKIPSKAKLLFLSWVWQPCRGAFGVWQPCRTCVRVQEQCETFTPQVWKQCHRLRRLASAALPNPRLGYGMTLAPRSGNHARSMRLLLKIQKYTYNCSKNIFILYFYICLFNQIYFFIFFLFLSSILRR